MRVLAFCVIILTGLSATSSVTATPVENSCFFLKIIGNNVSSGVPGMMDEIASSWPEANRIAAEETLSNLLNEITFSGGSVWQIAKLGNDIEEHLVLLRLADGEVSGVRLLYQWTADGFEMTTMDFKRRYGEIMETQILQTPQPIICGNEN